MEENGRSRSTTTRHGFYKRGDSGAREGLVIYKRLKQGSIINLAPYRRPGSYLSNK